MKKTIISSLISLMVFASISAYAHVDTIIDLKENKLVGLPEKYQPTEFSIDQNLLRIGDYFMVFDEYFQSYFEEGYNIEFLASWYGEGKPYLIMNLSPIGKNYTYSFLFNLDNLEFQGTSIRIEEEKIARIFRVEKCDDFLREINSSITKIEKQSNHH